MIKKRECAVRTVDLSFGYQGGSKKRALLLEGINLTINRGEMVGLYGLSGTGKSTLGDLLLGLRAPLQGMVYWGEERVFQNGSTPPQNLRPYYQKIYQNPTASFPPSQSTNQSLCDVINYYQPGISGENRERLLKESVEPLGLNMEHLKRFPHQLSGGEMQRLALARVMLLNPRFLVADEPTSRLDISVQAMIIRSIAEMAQTCGCGVLLISHDRLLIDAVCSRAYRLGRKVESSGGAGTLQPL